MKLRKIKLINWHIFTNHTIEVSENILISGENSSGKSTLMDALYFVLSGGDQKHFNSAASEGGQRNLETYLRGKIGSERKPFLRQEKDVIGYIVLEFFDKKLNESLALGCEIEIVSSIKPKTHFFVINTYEINDIDFIQNKHVVNFKQLKANFKVSGKELNELPESQTERRKKIGKDIFKIDDWKRFFELLQKAIAFKPISEVSTFVNSFLLAEDEINLDNLREEIRSYKEISLLLAAERRKMETLGAFVPKAEKYVLNVEKIRLLSVLKLEFEKIKLKKTLDSLNVEIHRLDAEYNRLESQLKLLEEDKRNIAIEIDNLENNEVYRAFSRKKQEKEKYEEILKSIEDELQEFVKLIKREQKIVQELNLPYKFDDDFRKEDFGLMQAHLEKYQDELKERGNNIRLEIADLNIKIKENTAKLKVKKKELDDLQKGLNNYPKDVDNLIIHIKNAITKVLPSEKQPEVRPLCEYIEVNDEKWSNALEGYLGNRKFNLIFNPKYYDIAYNAFKEYQIDRKEFVSGIVAVGKIADKIEQNNSLMSKTQIKNDWAKKYASYLLSDLICVGNIDEMDKYASSITADVMVYKDHALSSCDPSNYKIPYIGKESRKKRIRLIEDEIAYFEEEIDELNNKMAEKERILYCVDSSVIKEILKKNTNFWQQKHEYQDRIQDIKKDIEQYEKAQGLLEISDKLEVARKKQLEKIKKAEEINTQKEKLGDNRGRKRQQLEDKTNEWTSKEEEFNASIAGLDKEKYEGTKKTYIDGKNINYQAILSDSEKMQNYNNSEKSRLMAVMHNYSAQYNATLSPTIDKLTDFINEYHKLRNRDVANYEYDAKTAYERAEYSFREDFISKLREKIERARDMLESLNKNLAKHPFGNDEEIYKFSYTPSKDNEFGNYYRIIMSGKLMGTKDLFTEILDEKDMSYMKDLFDKISQDTQDNTTEYEMQRCLDYRNYMSYDIIITNKHGDETYFSKVSREKSGGETQTPFYLVMASCFNELMKKDAKIDSTCVVMFDEAFNNMDGSRIDSLMQFYRNLNVQIIVVVPSNRSDVVAEYYDTLLGVTKIDNYPYVTVTMKDE